MTSEGPASASALRLAISVSDKKAVDCHLSWHLYYCSLEGGCSEEKRRFVLYLQDRVKKSTAFLKQPNMFNYFPDPAGIKGYDCLHSMTFQYKWIMLPFSVQCNLLLHYVHCYCLLPHPHIYGKLMRAEIFCVRTVPQIWKELVRHSYTLSPYYVKAL